LDLVNLFSVERKRIKQVMESLGFVEEGRYFTYTGTDFFIEFPPGPSTVGVEPVKNVDEVRFVTGTMRITHYLSHRQRQRPPGSVLPLERRTVS
jgi:hypothetical protein